VDLDLDNLRSAGGIVAIVAIGWFFSEDRRAIRWRTVFAGVLLQAALGVAALIGTQVTQTEFIAYMKLASLQEGGISARAAMIATYSLCGFCNFGSMGIQLGGLGALAESRRHDFARLGLRAMLAGVLACNMTASLAGALVSRPEAEFRQAEAFARAAISAGDLGRAAAAYRAVAERNPGTRWAERAREAAGRVASKEAPP
jgi:nucleoside permease NupC